MAMTILLLGTASCSQSEDGIDIVTPPTSKAVTLGVNVGVNTGAKTRAAMKGTKIKYEEAAYATTDHAIGLVVTNADATGYYVAETENFEIGYSYTAPTVDICFAGDKDGLNWKAIDMSGTFPTSASGEKEKTFYLDKNLGQVFAYFPFDKSKKTKATITGGKITYPITILDTSKDKLVAADNSKQKFSGAAWAVNDATNSTHILAGETDYLYFVPEDGKGRKVNNGVLPAADGTVTPPDGSNTDENPGNDISLSMKHALSMVTFRLYDKDLVKTAPTGANSATTLGSVKSFKIENVAASDGPLKTGATTMNLNVTGDTDPIDYASTVSGSISRTLDKYLLIRARQTGTAGEKASASTFLYPEGGDGRDAANYISTLVYPIAAMSENTVKVTFDILEPGSTKSFPLTTTLTVPDDGGWLANKNYIYTFSVSKKGLNVVDVTVADWEDVEVGGVVEL